MVDEEEDVEDEREGRMMGVIVLEVCERRSVGLDGTRWMLTVDRTLLSRYSFVSWTDRRTNEVVLFSRGS